MIYSIWYFWSFFHFLHSNVPDKKCHKQKWRVLFFTRIKLVASVLVCARAIARIKWIRLNTPKLILGAASPASQWIILFMPSYLMLHDLCIVFLLCLSKRSYPRNLLFSSIQRRTVPYLKKSLSLYSFNGFVFHSVVFLKNSSSVSF